jgi:hypothetical protein
MRLNTKKLWALCWDGKPCAQEFLADFYICFLVVSQSPAMKLNKQASMGRPLQKSLDAIASSLSYLGDSLGSAIEVRVFCPEFLIFFLKGCYVP